MPERNGLTEDLNSSGQALKPEGKAVAAAQTGAAVHTSIKLFDGGTGGFHAYRIPSIVRTTNGTLIAICEGRADNATTTTAISTSSVKHLRTTAQHGLRSKRLRGQPLAHGATPRRLLTGTQAGYGSLCPGTTLTTAKTAAAIQNRWTPGGKDAFFNVE